MLSMLSRRLTYANVMSTLAVFGVLAGGTAYAANTVFSTDIVDGEVKSVDIANNSIHSADVLDNTINTFDVHSFLGVDVVDGTLSSADIGDETLTGDDIANGSLVLGDIGFDAILSQQVADFHLNDEDVGEAKLVDLAVDIGTLTATSCVNKPVAGLSASGDHVLLTPSLADAHGALMYDARYPSLGGDLIIHVCNFSTATINDGITHFNLLSFDAQ